MSSYSASAGGRSGGAGAAATIPPAAAPAGESIEAGQYRCAHCGGIFDCTWDDIVQGELGRRDPYVFVCDDCFLAACRADEPREAAR